MRNLDEEFGVDQLDYHCEQVQRAIMKDDSQLESRHPVLPIKPLGKVLGRGVDHGVPQVVDCPHHEEHQPKCLWTFFVPVILGLAAHQTLPTNG